MRAMKDFFLLTFSHFYEHIKKLIKYTYSDCPLFFCYDYIQKNVKMSYVRTQTFHTV